MPQPLGIVDLVWKGRGIPFSPDSGKIKLGGMKNTAIPYGRQVGRAITFEPSEIEVKTVLEKGQSVSELYGLEEGELVVLCDTGQTYTFREAFLIDSITLTANKGGEITLKFAAGTWQEVVAS